MPPSSYLVCATQRSGATLLGQLLSETGVAGRPEEYFEAMAATGLPPHPADFLGSLPDVEELGIAIEDLAPAPAPDYSSLVGIADYREHLARVRRLGTTPNGVFATKMMFNQLPELRELCAPLPEYAGLGTAALLGALFDDPHYVWVTRTDKVTQAAMVWRALQIRQWYGGGEGEPVYSFAGIDHLVASYEAHDAAWGDFFTDNGISAVVIGYEQDLLRDPDGTVRRVLDEVGVTPPEGWRAVIPPYPVDPLSEEWSQAYRRDREQRRAATR